MIRPFLSRQKRTVLRALANGRVYAHAAVRGTGDLSHCFVVFAQGRTGSTLLGTLLQSHPAIDFEDEILNIDAHRRPFVSPYLYTVGRRRLSGAKSYGYHVKIYQLSRDHRVDPGRFVRRAHGDGWKILYLARFNLLRHALSNIRAETTKTYFHYVDEEPGEERRTGLRLDPDDLIERMEEREHFLEREAEILADVPHFPISYERDLMDADRHQPTAEAIFDHLGLDVAGVEVGTRLKRINRGGLPELIRNYDEVERALRGTRFERFLEEDWSAG